MADISMNYAIVSDLEDKAEFLQSGFDDFMRDFNRITGGFMSEWDGKAKTDFAAKCEAMLPSMYAISEMLHKYSNAIHQAVYLQQSTDQSGAESFRSGQSATLLEQHASSKAWLRSGSK